MDIGFGYWLAGFIDGEGSFNCAIYPSKSGASLVVTPSFTLGLRADEKPILEEIHQVLGFGRLYYTKQYPGTQSPKWQWQCSSKSDCQALVSTLDEYPLRAKKSRDFDVWREIVMEHAGWRLPGGKANLNEESLVRIQALSSRLRADRRYDPQYEL